MMSHPQALDATCCPLCGQPNRCAAEVRRATGQEQPPCWCTQPEFNFSAELLAKAPPKQRGLACICARCAALDNSK
jgi:hypothetical protein